MAPAAFRTVGGPGFAFPPPPDWHVQFETEDTERMTRATVRGRSAADAVRNAYYVFPQATTVRINKLEHPDVP